MTTSVTPDPLATFPLETRVGLRQFTGGDVRVDSGRWRESALCAQVDPAVFFPEKGESAAPAREICYRCDVRRECLESALADPGDDHGIRGGLIVRERDRLRRLRRDAS